MYVGITNVHKGIPFVSSTLGCYEEVWQFHNSSKLHYGYAHPQWGQLA
jgi:hypothetical protein